MHPVRGNSSVYFQDLILILNAHGKNTLAVCSLAPSFADYLYLCAWFKSSLSSHLKGLFMLSPSLPAVCVRSGSWRWKDSTVLFHGVIFLCTNSNSQNKHHPWEKMRRGGAEKFEEASLWLKCSHTSSENLFRKSKWVVHFPSFCQYSLSTLEQGTELPIPPVRLFSNKRVCYCV